LATVSGSWATVCRVSDRSPRVAVVIPCFDDGATLPATLQSLSDQEPCEVVVVDDGSQDEGTLHVLLELERRGVRVLRQENAGPAAARSAGLHATAAPYVFPLDADDLVAPGALSELADVLDGDPGVALAWGDTEMFGAVRLRVRKGRSLDPWLLVYANPIPTGSLIRREAVVEVGGWASVSGYEDWDLWMSLAERGWRGVHLDRVVGKHRVHGSRRWQADFGRQAQIEQELRRRHPDLMAARRRNWRRSDASPLARLLLPVLVRTPLSATARYRLTNLITSPGTAIRFWAQRLRRRAPAQAALDAEVRSP
jgi:glycosyltransferase involved in cell wall biosynthesis